METDASWEGDGEKSGDAKRIKRAARGEEKGHSIIAPASLCICRFVGSRFLL